MRKNLKRLKGFTLIELIIVMAIFGIIMVGVIQFIAPVSELYNSTSLKDSQRSAQNSMLKYLTESTKHATRIMIIENPGITNIDDAKKLFLDYGLTSDIDLDADSVDDVHRYVSGYECSMDPTSCPARVRGEPNCDNNDNYELQATAYQDSDIEVIEIDRTNGRFNRLKAGATSPYQAISGVYGNYQYQILITRIAPKYSKQNQGGYSVLITSNYERGDAKSDYVSADAVGFDNLAKKIEPSPALGVYEWVQKSDDSTFTYCGPGTDITDETEFIRIGRFVPSPDPAIVVNAFTDADGELNDNARANGIDVDGNIAVPYVKGNTYICFTKK